LCAQRLGLTDWNRKLVTDAMMQRLQQPPLSTQFNNPERIQRLKARQEAILAAMTPEAAKAAQASYQEAIAEQPEDHYLHEAYAAFLQATGHLADATHEWQIVSGLLPQDFLPWFQMGVLQSRQGNQPAAQQNLRKALELRPGLVEGWSELGQSLGLERRWEPALAAFQQACALRSQDPSLWAYQAKVLGEMGRADEAVEAYRTALKLNPRYWQAQGALGDLLAQSGRIPEALTEYEAVLRQQPDNAVALFNRGELLLRQGRENEAREAFLRVLELDPNHAPARLRLERLQSAIAPGP
jgi:superkiller protein 3